MEDSRWYALKKKHQENRLGGCRYFTREIVECDSATECSRCGWNPYEEKRRKDEEWERRERLMKAKEPKKSTMILGSGAFTNLKKCP